MAEMMHLKKAELEAGLDEIRQSPQDEGVLEMIVSRPDVNARQVVEEGELDPSQGLVGDNWITRGGARALESPSYRERQLTLMNARAAALVAGERSRWPLAGDQLYLDMDLSDDNLPPGSRLSIGSAVVEVSAVPHTGCQKFEQRFGSDALAFVNSPLGKQLHLRGINAKVIKAGAIRAGDVARKIS